MAYNKPKNLHDLKILYVDDSESSCMIFKNMFEHFGIKNDIAISGEDAVEQCVEQHYDMIFMDCFESDIDAFVSTKCIRDNERAELLDPSVIIALADEVTAVLEVKAASVGMNGLVKRPMTVDLFKSLIKQWLNISLDDDVFMAQSMESGFVAGRPLSQQTIDSYLDKDITHSLKSILKDNYSKTVDLFKSDINTYVEAAYQGVEKQDISKVHDAMHTVKSASFQIGLVKVSSLASQLEDLCASENGGIQLNLLCDIIRAQMDHIQHVYSLSEGLLEQTK